MLTLDQKFQAVDRMFNELDKKFAPTTVYPKADCKSRKRAMMNFAKETGQEISRTKGRSHFVLGFDIMSTIYTIESQGQDWVISRVGSMDLSSEKIMNVDVRVWKQLCITKSVTKV